MTPSHTTLGADKRMIPLTNSLPVWQWLPCAYVAVGLECNVKAGHIFLSACFRGGGAISLVGPEPIALRRKKGLAAPVSCIQVKGITAPNVEALGKRLQ